METFSEPITVTAGVAVLLLSLPLQPSTTTRRLTVAVILLAIWAMLVPMRTVRYGLAVTTILWVIEGFWGRQPLWLWSVICVVISPLFRYLTEVFSFPIRLQISQGAGWILTQIGYPIQVVGNTLTWQGADFNVDPACMGLHLLGFSYLAAVFLIGQEAKKSRRFFSTGWILALLIAVFGLNIFANLVRIVALVLGGWQPKHPMHEMIGLISILVYVWLPLGIIIRFLHRRRTVNHLVSVNKIPLFNIKNHCLFKFKKQHILYFLAIGGVAYICFMPVSSNAVAYPDTLLPAGYEQSFLPKGIRQLRNAHSLIYLKSIPAFYSVEHSPYICWRGSGYGLQEIREVSVGDKQIYKACLTKDKQRLYTAWWFSDGKQHTNSQLAFRWQMLRHGRRFHLINVTVSQEKDLEQTIKQMLDTEVSSI